MAALDLGAVDAFPFLDPPGPRAIADGYQLLQELGAIDAARALTPAGRELARLPLDPRIGRILLAARESGCVAEALVIAAALAVPDPRERPLERQQAADQAHLRFRDERSDFLSLVTLWEFVADLFKQGLSHRKRVDACRAQFVNHLRATEWRDVHQQLANELAECGWTWTAELPRAFDAARYATLHRALLAGLLGNVGAKGDEGEGYLGTRGLRFHVHPGSGLAKKGPKWVVASELVETTRLYARCVGRVEPDWIEAAAGERVTRDYFEPRWDESRGEVVASMRVQLYGLTLVPRRVVSFGAIDPPLAREVFIREALVPGALATRGAFLAHNRRLVAEVAELEHKARRQDVLVDPETIAAFYAERLPQDVATLAAFERWRAVAEAQDPQVLHLTREALMRHAAASITEEQFPETLAMAGATAAAQVPLRPRPSAGRAHDHRAARAPQPARRRAAHLARSRDDPREGDRVPEVAAQGAAQPHGAAAGARDGVPGSDDRRGAIPAGGAAHLVQGSLRRVAADRRLRPRRPAAPSPRQRARRGCVGRRACERSRPRGAAPRARAGGADDLRRRRAVHRAQGPDPLGLRPPAGDARRRPRWGAAHRLPGPRGRARQRGAAADGYRGGSACGDPRRHRAPDPHRPQGRAVAVGEGRAGIRAAGAAAQGGDRRPTCCAPT